MDYQPVQRNEFDSQQKQGVVGLSLSEDLRINFARKVFSIVAIQLSLTSLFVYGVMKFEVIATLCTFAFVPALIVGILMTIWLHLSKSACRQFPKNIILLSIFTVCEAICLSISCLSYADPDLVFQAFIVTAGVVIALTAYAMTTKTDLSLLGGTLFLFFIGSLLCGLYSWISGSHTAYMIYLLGGVMIFGFYLIYDIQLICGDKKRALTIDDYVLGSMLIYTDIIRMFIKIMQSLNELKKEK